MERILPFCEQILSFKRSPHPHTQPHPHPQFLSYLPLQSDDKIFQVYLFL